MAKNVQINNYVYIHIKETDGIPFYVGKGKDKRAYSIQGRNKWWKNTVAKHGYDIIMLEENLTADEACEREIYWIKRIGRKDLGLGPLVNVTDGGEGVNGRIYITSNETKRKLSEAHTGKQLSDIHKNAISQAHKNRTNFRSGHKLSDEHKLKISKACKGKSTNGKKVIDSATGVIYKSLSEAARINGITISTLSKYLVGTRTNKTTLAYI